MWVAFAFQIYTTGGAAHHSHKPLISCLFCSFQTFWIRTLSFSLSTKSTERLLFHPYIIPCHLCLWWPSWTIIYSWEKQIQKTKRKKRKKKEIEGAQKNQRKWSQRRIEVWEWKKRKKMKQRCLLMSSNHTHIQITTYKNFPQIPFSSVYGIPFIISVFSHSKLQQRERKNISIPQSLPFSSLSLHKSVHNTPLLILFGIWMHVYIMERLKDLSFWSGSVVSWGFFEFLREGDEKGVWRFQ